MALGAKTNFWGVPYLEISKCPIYMEKLERTNFEHGSDDS